MLLLQENPQPLNNWLLVALVLLLAAIALLLWLIRRKRPSRYRPDPSFPIPRPPSDYVEPPRREIVIKTRRGEPGLDIGDVTISPNEQVAWTGGARNALGKGLRIEIRFSPNRTPFRGAKFITAGGGVTLSGRPDAKFVGQSFAYLVLVTTADGDLITDSANISVAPASTRAN